MGLMKSFLIYILIVGIVALGLYVSLMQYEYGLFRETPETKQDIIDACEGLDLDSTARCLVGNVRTFFDYELHQKNSSTIQDFKDYGGNCVSYTNLYLNLSEELGFESEKRTYNFIEDISYGHRWAVIWDDERYCELDQKSYKCDDRILRKWRIKFED